MRNYYRAIIVIFSHYVEQASDTLSMNIERLPIYLVCRKSLKHCQRHNGPEGRVHLAKVILQVQTQILIEFHLQILDSASTKHQHLH